MFYIYRCTTQQLEASLNSIAESGDTVVQPVHTGGRDWILVCRKGGFASELRESAEERQRLSTVVGRLETKLASLESAVQGARKGAGDRAGR